MQVWEELKIVIVSSCVMSDNFINLEVEFYVLGCFECVTEMQLKLNQAHTGFFDYWIWKDDKVAPCFKNKNKSKTTRTTTKNTLGLQTVCYAICFVLWVCLFLSSSIFIFPFYKSCYCFLENFFANSLSIKQHAKWHPWHT